MIPCYLLKFLFVKYFYDKDPANIRLDENGFRLRLPKTSSWRLRDILKTSSRPLQNLFKKSSRRFQDVSSSYTILVNKFPRCLQDVFITFLRRSAKTEGYLLNDFPRSYIWENYGQCTKLTRVTTVSQVLVFTLLYLLVAAYRGVFRACSNSQNIWD